MTIDARTLCCLIVITEIDNKNLRRYWGTQNIRLSRLLLELMLTIDSAMKHINRLSDLINVENFS